MEKRSTRFFNKLNFKLALPALLLLLVAFIVIGTVAVGIQKKVFREGVINGADRIITGMRQHVRMVNYASESVERDFGYSISSMANAIDEILSSKATSINSDVLENLAQKMHVFDIRVTDKKGVVTQAVNPDDIGYDYSVSNQTYLQALSNARGAWAGEPYHRESDGKLVQYIATKRKEASGLLLIGVENLVLDNVLKVGMLDYVVKNNAGDSDRSVFILNENGVVIAHNNTAMIGTAIDATDWERILSNENIRTIGEEIVTLNDRHSLVRFTRYRDLIFAADVVDERNVLEAIKALGEMFLVMVFLLGACVFAFYVVTRRLISTPLVSLETRMAAIAEGDLTVVFTDEEVKRKDEIGGLFASAHNMVSGLRGTIGRAITVADRIAGVSQELAASAEETGASMEELNASLQHMVAASQEIAGSASQGQQAMVENNRGTEHIAERSQQIAMETEKGGEIIQQGLHMMKNTSNIVSEMSRQANEVNKVVEELDGAMFKITEFTEMIGEISDETNLLALNAAIEAARAGDAGRGFAVVADHVRKLAEESASAASQVGEIASTVKYSVANAVSTIKNLQSLMQDGKQKTDLTMGAVESIGEVSEATLDSVREIATTVEQQLASTQQVRAMINDFLHASEEQAKGSQEMTSAVEEQTLAAQKVAELAAELNLHAHQLNQAASKFKIGNGQS